jgi:CNT family concentrative nucleoside transporter
MWQQSFLGLLIIPCFAWLISENRKVARFKILIISIVIQLILAWLLLKFPPFQQFFLALNQVVTGLEQATLAGTSFVFGYLGGATLPYQERIPHSSVILAFRILPIILVMSSLSSLLFYWRILPVLVKILAWGLKRTFGIGGALGLATAANVFVGMVEAPLFIRPYLKSMTHGELFAVMTAGMSTIAGTVMFLYASILATAIPDAMGNILTASIISAPAALAIADLMVPLGDTVTTGDLSAPHAAQSSMDAVTIGAIEGLTLFLNIIALLIVLVALVHLANQILALSPEFISQPVTLQRIFGWCMAPLMWLLGIPWAEAQVAGALMGTKTVLNELIAYSDLAQLPAGVLSERSRLILVYAMCGFANFGSLGIMIGGMGTMAPERRDEIVALGMKSIISGTLASCMTGAIVGILI